MNALTHTLAVLVLAAAAGPAAAQNAIGRDTSPLKPPRGSVARQLMLRYRLEKIANGTLTASLDHNRTQWERFSPEQRERYRDEALAFLKANPAQQEKLVAHYEKLMELSARRREKYRRTAEWIQAVVATLSEEQRAELLQMSAERRARILRERRDELIRAGELTIDPPATAPATKSPVDEARDTSPDLHAPASDGALDEPLPAPLSPSE